LRQSQFCTPNNTIEDCNGLVCATLPLDEQHQRLAEGVAQPVGNGAADPLITRSAGASHNTQIGTVSIFARSVAIPLVSIGTVVLGLRCSCVSTVPKLQGLCALPPAVGSAAASSRQKNLSLGSGDQSSGASPPLATRLLSAHPPGLAAWSPLSF
jgi:hypothetical protein